MSDGQDEISRPGTLEPVTDLTQSINKPIPELGILNEAHASFERGMGVFGAGEQLIAHPKERTAKFEYYKNMANIAEETIKINNEKLSWGQYVSRAPLDFIADTLGGVYAAPETIAFGWAGRAIKPVLNLLAPLIPGGAAGLLAKTGADILGEKALPKYVAEQTVGGLAKEAAVVGSEVAAFMLPAEVYEAYNQDLDTIDFGKFAKAYSTNLFVGFGLGTLPFAAGAIWGKVKGRWWVGKEVPHPGRDHGYTPEHIQQDVENGHITQAEGDFMQRYLHEPFHTNNQQDATFLLKKSGIPVNDLKHEVNFELFSGKDIENINNVIADQIMAPQEVKTALSDFMIHNRLDKMRENPEVVEGIRGFIEATNYKLEKKPEQMIKLQEVARKYLPENLRREAPFSQRNIYAAIKNEGLAAVESRMHIPEAVRIKHQKESRIKVLKNKVKQYQKHIRDVGHKETDILNRGNQQVIKKYNRFVSKAEKEIADIMAEPTALVPHDIELDLLRDELMPNGIVKDNVELTSGYSRLMDLTRMSQGARNLMMQLHVEQEYAKQAAIKDMLESLAKIIETPGPRLADPRNVVRYLNERISSTKQYPDYITPSNVYTIEAPKAVAKLKTFQKVPAESVEILQEEIGSHADSHAITAKTELKAAFEKLEEFKRSPEVFKNLMECLRRNVGG